MAIEGLPISESAIQLGNEYLSKYDFNKEKAAAKLIATQVTKCATMGFLTGFGGFIVLPITLPADVAGNLYVQIRMIVALAVMGGLNPNDDEVKTLVYATLVGMSITDIVKQAGIKVGNKMALQVIKQVPGKVLTKINQKIGFRLITKFGEKGIINLAKMIPITGGPIGAIVDLVATKKIAKNAKALFITNKN